MVPAIHEGEGALDVSLDERLDRPALDGELCGRLRSRPSRADSLARSSGRSRVTTLKILDIRPTPAPRQSRRDRWAPSKAVREYRAFRDHVGYKIQELPEDFFHVVFILPMSESWSEKKKRATCGWPHKLKPDADNQVKALIDAVYRGREDSHVWNYATTKLWGFTGVIMISDDFIPFYELPVNLAELVRGSWDVYDHRTPIV